MLLQTYFWLEAKGIEPSPNSFPHGSSLLTNTNRAPLLVTTSRYTIYTRTYPYTPSSLSKTSQNV